MLLNVDICLNLFDAIVYILVLYFRYAVLFPVECVRCVIRFFLPYSSVTSPYCSMEWSLLCDSMLLLRMAPSPSRHICHLERATVLLHDFNYGSWAFARMIMVQPTVRVFSSRTHSSFIHLWIFSVGFWGRSPHLLCFDGNDYKLHYRQRFSTFYST